jgi:signal transduction histidine kinase
MEKADEIFVPFHRLHRAEEFAGFGIGLATAKRIIQRHGCRIWAESEEHKGAAFFFTLQKLIRNKQSVA